MPNPKLDTIAHRLAILWDKMHSDDVDERIDGAVEVLRLAGVFKDFREHYGLTKQRRKPHR